MYWIRSTGLLQLDINAAITILDIIHRFIIYLKHNVSETGFCLRLEAERTQLVPVPFISGRQTKTGPVFDTLC
jgi:hypothetical protein